MNLAGRIPFWTGYNQPPITHANLPSLSVLNNNNSSNQVLTHSTIITNQISSSTPPGITNRKTDCVTSLQQSTLPTFDEDTAQVNTIT